MPAHNRIDVLARWRDRIDYASMLAVLGIEFSENAHGFGSLVGFAREIRADRLPTVAAVDGFETRTSDPRYRTCGSTVEKIIGMVRT